MTICGIEMSASEAILVVVSGTKSNLSHSEVELRKLKLSSAGTAS